MSDILVLGPGCQKCTLLYDRARQAVKELGVECEVVKVSDINAILGFGVLMTPALVVDGAVKVAGRVPTVQELKEMLS